MEEYSIPTLEIQDFGAVSPILASGDRELVEDVFDIV